MKTLMSIIKNDPIWMIYLGFILVFFILIIGSAISDHRIEKFQKEALSYGYASYINGEFIWKKPAKIEPSGK